MMSNCRITLLDVDTSQDEDSGEREKIIVSQSSILGQKGSVGMQTYWSATANNIKLSCVFTVRRRVYHNQKYIYADNEIYEIDSTGKGAMLDQIQLNAKILKDEKLKEMIKHALGIM